MMSLTPFLRYRWGAPHSGAHMDHEPRHGGLLGMVGEDHLEIVRTGGLVECHPSDAHRVAREPVGGWVECGGGGRVPAVVEGNRLVAPDRCRTKEVTCHVLLGDGLTLRMSAELPLEAL